MVPSGHDVPVHMDTAVMHETHTYACKERVGGAGEANAAEHGHNASRTCMELSKAFKRGYCSDGLTVARVSLAKVGHMTHIFSSILSPHI